MTEHIKQIILKDFLESLTRSNHMTNNRVSIIVDKPDEAFLRSMPEEFLDKSVVLTVDAKTTTGIFTHISKDLSTKDFIFIFIKSDIADSIFNQFVLLAKEGFIDVLLPGKTIKTVEHLRANNNIILVGERSILENQHANILNLGNQFLDMHAYD